MAKRKKRISAVGLLKAIKSVKTRLGMITATIVGDEDLPQAMLDAAYDHGENLRAVEIVLGRLADNQGARINQAALDALWELVEETRAYLAQPEVALAGPMMEAE